MDSLVSCEWLRANLNDPDLVVVDCTNSAAWSEDRQGYVTVSGQPQWARGHIPGSRHADFTDGLAGDDTLFRNSLPTPAEFARNMGRLGVSQNSRVVLYDNADSQWAARVWWTLRWIGFDRAAVLDGGWRQWQAQGGPVSDGSTHWAPDVLNLAVRPELFVTHQDVMDALEDGQTLLIDALSTAQFSGQGEDLGLSGHIPGAVNIPGTSMIDPNTDCFLPLGTLQDKIPYDHDRRAILYCGSGIAAAAVAFAMTRLGFGDLSIYMPGLQEWIAKPSAPLTRG